MAREKKRDVWQGRLREIAQARDERLGSVARISTGRRAALRAFLAQEFPVDAAMREVGTRRDRLRPAPEIPLRVALALQRSLTSARPIGSRRFIYSGLVAACLAVGLGVVFLAQWASPERRTPGATIRVASIQRSVLPSASRHPFGLRISEAEIASLRSSFLAANQPLPNEEAGASASLRLDLPVQALLGDNSSASIP